MDPIIPPPPPDPAAAEPDSLDRGIQVAFGVEAEFETPVSSRALDAFRRAGRLPQVSLRETDEGRSPVVLPGKASEPFLAGTGRYRVSGEIARGGVGAVLKAHDHDLGRDVALKVLLEAHRGNAEMTRRFLEEAQIAAQLQHPGIVPVHEIGVLADDRPYFAMELVKGHTLAELLQSRASPGEGRQRFLAVFGQICQTLAYAHSRGVVHRDLKPSNVMVGAFGEVQVMDWGVAKVLHRSEAAGLGATTVAAPGAPGPAGASPEAPAVSFAGTVLGTPAYMPPEQARGAVREIDERADVFGLGGILCELLTGKPPYAGKSSAEALRQAQEGELAETWRRLEQSGADRELIDLARSCLAADPVERPHNAVVVAKRVASYLEAAGRRAQELQARAARARLRLGLALSILAAVLLGGGGFVWIERQRRAQERQAALAATRAMSEARELRAQALGGGDPALWDGALREARRALELATGAAGGAVVAEASGLHAELAAQVGDQRMVAELEGLREERDLDFGEQEDRFREVFADYGLDVENTLPARVAKQIRESSIATHLVLALDQWAITGPFGPRGFERQRLLEIAELADDDPWRTRLRRALRSEDTELRDQLVAEAATAEFAAPTLEMLAAAVRGGPQEATPQEKAVWRRAQELHPHDFWVNVSLGDVLRRSGNNADALQYMRAAVALRPGNAHGRYKLGAVLLDQGSFAEAFDQLERSLALDSSNPFTYFRLARVLEEGSGSIPRPRLELLRAFLERLAAGGTGYPDDARTGLLAEVLLALGEPRRALLALERVERQRGRSMPGAAPGPPGWMRRGHFSSAEILVRHRELARPDLISFASIDAALAAGGSQPSSAETVAAFRRLHEGAEAPGVRARLLYLEGRKLQDQGEYQAAAAVFSRVIDLDAGLPEPFLRRAESLRQAGSAVEAEGFLGEALGREDLQYPEAWKLWVRLSFADLGRSAREALDHFPGAPGDRGAEERGQPPDYAADLRRVLETIAAAEPVRIEALAMGFSPGFTGRPPDRGTARAPRRVEPQLVKRRPRAGAALSFMARGRLPAGYEVPLPPGSYRVELRVPEGVESAGLAALSPTLEGQPIIGAAEVSPASAGQEASWVSTLRIDDGFLDLQWTRDRGNSTAFAVVIRKLD